MRKGDRLACAGLVLLACFVFLSQGRAEEISPAQSPELIPIRNMRPYSLLFLQFMPETADVLAPGTSEYGAQLDIANNLLAPSARTGPTVVEDNEYQRLLLSYREGLADNMEAAVYVPVEWRDGGVLDGIISAYHHLIGVNSKLDDDPGGRDSHRKYQSILELVGSEGQTLVQQGNGFGFGETIITLKRSLLRSTSRSGLGVRIGIKLPTGNPTVLLGTGHPDFGVSVDGRYSFSRNFGSYLNVGLVAMGSAGRVPGARSSMVQELMGMEYQATHRDEFLFQVDRSTPPVLTHNRIADDVQAVDTWGYQRSVRDGFVVYGAFSENGDIFNYKLRPLINIGPDFTLMTGVRWRP